MMFSIPDRSLMMIRGEKGVAKMAVVPLGLGDFLARARVLKLYRHSIRVARRAPPNSRAELMLMIRREFENNRSCDDRQRIRFLISEGGERLKGLDEMLDMQGH